ncbi:hypothetical protein GCM10020221_19550 [Streptomyces thioluteus]|uniref:GS catalytic domain-containing protein n=1 Tax=Streptomyces thioluteus TaxID=66431 RepID=A0ABN3WPA6_STRTU
MDQANAEVKCFDGAANPYLAAGAVIAAGLAGIEAGLALPPPVTGDPAVTGGQERLPASPADALDRFTRSDLLRTALGDPLFEAVAAVRRAEVRQYAGAAPQDIADATRRRY